MLRYPTVTKQSARCGCRRVFQARRSPFTAKACPCPCPCQIDTLGKALGSGIIRRTIVGIWVLRLRDAILI